MVCAQIEKLADAFNIVFSINHNQDLMRTVKAFMILLLLIISATGFSQGTSINNTGNAPDPSAGLDVSFDNKGVLVPRISNLQRNAITAPAEGLLIFNTTTKCFNVFKNSQWFELCGNCIAPPAPVAAGNGPVCAGDSIKLTASNIPGAAYNWTGPAGFTSSLQNPVIPVSSIANTGTYYVTAVVNGCSSAAASAVVQVVQLPSANFTHSPTTVNPNTNITFSPATSGAAYNWSFQSGNPSSSTSQNPVVQWTTTGTYAVSLTVTSGGCSATVSQNVSVISSAITINTYNWNNHQYLIDCDHYGCGTATQQATCFCNSNGYATMVSFTTGYITTTDCFGYMSPCVLQPTWCSGSGDRYVITTVTCQ